VVPTSESDGPVFAAAATRPLATITHRQGNFFQNMYKKALISVSYATLFKLRICIQNNRNCRIAAKNTEK